MIVWPWSAWLRARRQVRAALVWLGNVGPVERTRGQEVRLAMHDAIVGYFEVRDWIGVESVYEATREIVARFIEGTRSEP